MSVGPVKQERIKHTPS